MAGDFSPLDASSSIPDDLLLRIASHLPAADLASLQSASTRLRDLEGVDRLWRRLCEVRWKDWPLYRVTPARVSWLDGHLGPGVGWRGRYAWAERDVRRTATSPAEMEGLRWYFNFTRSAGGGGTRTLSRCHFDQGRLYVLARPPHPPFGLLYPPLPYELVDGPVPSENAEEQPSVGDAQWLRIADFPPHTIERIPEDGQWLIANENVTLVSTNEEGALTYTGRSFQSR